MEIRPAEVGDREAAGNICIAVLPGGHPYPYQMNIGVPSCLNFVAVEGSFVVGFISVLLTRSASDGKSLWQRVAPYIAFIGVSPAWQGSGNGEKLLKYAIDSVHRGYPNEEWIYLEHEPESLARRFYERMGFMPMTPEQVLAVSGLDLNSPIMRLNLTGIDLL